jgi:hypothetical protein
MADIPQIDQNHVFPEPEVTKKGDYVPRVVSPPVEEVIPVQYPQQTQPQTAPQQQVYPQQGVNQQYNPNQPTQYQQVSNSNQFYQNIQQDVQTNPYFQVGPEQAVQSTNTNSRPKSNAFSFGKLGGFLAAKWWLVAGIIGVLILGGVGLFAFLRYQATPQGDFTNVEARIEGPNSSPSGSPNRWKVTINNREKVSIQQIEVKLEFDRSFRFSKPINPDPADPKGNLYKLVSLAPLGQGTSDAIISFEGILTGSIDEETVMKGEVSYIPTPLSGKQNSKRSIPIQATKTRITAPEIKVEMIPTQQEVQNGNEAELAVYFENLSERELKDLRIRMLYPAKGSFSYTSSELALSSSADIKTKPDDGNDIWFISSLPRLKKQTLKIRGNLNGADGVKQTFGVEIGIKTADGYQTLQSTTRDITVSSQPLIISTKLSGRDENRTFAPGEPLTFEVTYQNKSTSTLKDVELFGSVDDSADILDYSSLQFVGGVSGNINNRVVQWRSSGVPQLANLAPQVKGTVTYTVKVKSGEEFTKSGLNQTAFTLRPNIEAKASNLPQIKAGGELYKARGDIGIEQKIEVDTTDANSQNRKTYNVTLTLKSKQNAVNDVTYETSTTLPPSSWQQASITPATFADKISYNQQNGKIVWKVGKVNGYTGSANPVISVTFKMVVEIAPGKSFAGVEMFGEGKLTGVDDFTGEEYSKQISREALTN